MNTGNNEQTEIFFELFLDQINIILAVISRPVVPWYSSKFLRLWASCSSPG